MTDNTLRRRKDFFPGFAHAAYNISAFRVFLDIFILSLKDGTIVRFDAGLQRQAFEEWLRDNGIREV